MIIVYESNARKKIKFKVGQNLINLESLSIGIEILIITNLTEKSKKSWDLQQTAVCTQLHVLFHFS